MQQLEMKLAEKHIKDANEEIAEKVQVLEKAKKNLAAKEAVLNTKKESLRKSLLLQKKKRNIFILYLRLTEKVEASSAFLRPHSDQLQNGLSVVPVERDACGGALMRSPPERQSEIKQRKKIIVCENCGRILVDRDCLTRWM